ncbi:MAG: FAD:protein FMN transferase [Candidatus Moranbacteria bacterium]|nr:FAD:protein FMN transferase [Candidatus Moranbacteria bacterium]
MNNRIVFDNFRAMGTDISVEIVVSQEQEKQAHEALQRVKEIFAENEKIFSRFDDGSELSKINASLNKEIAVSDKMFEVLELCVKFNTISDGYFDPRVIGVLEKIGYDKDFKSNDLNTKEAKEIEAEKFEADLLEDLILDAERKTVLIHKRIDTTGIAKGYTVDEVAQYLKKEGWENFVVDAGGDMFAQGLNEDSKNWTIGVEGAPDDKVVLKLQQEGIATSGISRKRWTIGDKKVHHLINPKDPENFSYDIKTVTVIDIKTVEADGRAKTLVLMGKEKGLEFANKNNIKALFLDYRGNVYLSDEIKNNIL